MTVRGLGRALFIASLVVIGGSARAHDPFAITTEAQVAGDGLNLHTTMSLPTATRTCLRGPAALRQLAPGELAALRSDFESCARDFYEVTSGGEALAVRAVSVALLPGTDVDLRVTFAGPTRTPLVFDAPNLKGVAAQAGVVLTVTAARSFLGQALLRPEATRLEIPIGPDGEAPGTPPLPSFRQYLGLGIRHILTGYDHLLFLVGLLVVCRHFRTVAGIVTCFTLAHSVTLALAALEVVRLPGRIVEPLIAATIVFVGVENILRGEEPRGRWVLTFGFGLIHGLGFASALRDIGLGAFGTSIVGPLVGFNLGVELGQLSVAAVLLALLGGLRRRLWFARHGTRLVSAVVAAIGLFWLVQRIAA